MRRSSITQRACGLASCTRAGSDDVGDFDYATGVADANASTAPTGFSDTFNESQGFYDETYMGLDQAQTVAMIENYRTGLLWKIFMSNPEIKPALDKIGFLSDP